MNIQKRGRRYQLRIIHKLLPRPFFHSFDTWEEASAYGTQLESILARGVVPQDLLIHLQEPKARSDAAVVDVIKNYVSGNAAISRADREMVAYIKPDFVGVMLSRVSFEFAVGIVRKMKIERTLAPSTIRARVGCLGRVFDWHFAHTDSKAANVWRLLPTGYSVYSDAETAELIAAGKAPRRDQKRDRRLAEGEDEKIRRVLAGERLRDDRERAMPADPELAVMYSTIVDTGMRLREAYTLTVQRVDLFRREIAVAGTKGHRGALKPRNVPIKGSLHRVLKPWIESLPAGETRLFPGRWDGSSEERDLERTTGRLGSAFANVFEHAGCVDLTEHDLRHEATCRWVTLRRPDGAWLRSDTEIVKIMGWSSSAMLARYASLRGEDLAHGLEDF